MYQKTWKKIAGFVLLCSLLTGCSGGKGSPLPSGSPAGTPAVSGAPEADSTEEAVTPPPTLYVEKSRFKAGETIYSDNVRNITALGLKEYKKITKGQYKDRPSKGKKYLVLFLDVYNGADEDLYFNVNYLSAKVDGKAVENTYLLNDPERYKTIFQSIGAKGHREGFIVWEVPKDWKKMTVTFKEFEILGGKRLKLSFTRKDLKDPPAPSMTEQ